MTSFFMSNERNVTERMFPGLLAKITEIDLEILESPGNPSIQLFREAGGPGMLVPVSHGGLGATPLEAIRVHRMIGSVAPSLSIAATMHNFSLATLVGMCVFGNDEYADTLLSSVAEQRLFLASGFAEGRPNTSIMAPSMEAKAHDGGWFISGRKQPCSLSRSMDLLSASVVTPSGSRAVVLVPADSPGIEIAPFWKSPILGGAESDSVTLKDVFVPQEFLSFPQTEESLDPLEKLGYFWFWLLVSASYVGVASGLVQRVVEQGRGSAQDRALICAKIETCMAALEGIAMTAQLGEPDVSRDLPRLLMVRLELEETIMQVVSSAAGCLGGMSFISGSSVARYLASARPLAMHPPSRSTSIPAIDAYLRTGTLPLV